LALDEKAYSELFSGAGYESPFPGASTAKACGACLEITGPLGSVIGVVQEVAEIASFGDRGAPDNILVAADAFAMVSEAVEPEGLRYLLVSCPDNGNIQVRREAWTSASLLGFTVYNHKSPVAAVEIQPAGQSGHPWVPLVNSFNNVWMLLNGGTTPRPLDLNGSQPIRLRVISIHGAIVVTDSIPLVGFDEDPVEGFFDAMAQFPEGEVSDECSDTPSK